MSDSRPQNWSTPNYLWDTVVADLSPWFRDLQVPMRNLKLAEEEADFLNMAYSLVDVAEVLKTLCQKYERKAIELRLRGINNEKEKVQDDNQ